MGITVGDGAIGRRLFINICSDGDNIGSMVCGGGGLLIISCVVMGWIMGLYCEDGSIFVFLDCMCSLLISDFCMCSMWKVMDFDDGSVNDCIRVLYSLFSSICD